jgi:Uma2 family endonuclease
MPVQTLISVGEYLRSSYEHDKEYVDGELIERKMPTAEHGKLQIALGSYLFQSVQVREGAFRIPDVSVVSDVHLVSDSSRADLRDRHLIAP